eukprot:scaffold57598_cov59-Phaeocystis_antarctica.AAC.3
MNWSRVLYDDLGGRGGGRKPAAGGHRKVAHAIANQRIKTGRISRQTKLPGRSFAPCRCCVLLNGRC